MTKITSIALLFRSFYRAQPWPSSSGPKPKSTWKMGHESVSRRMSCWKRTEAWLAPGELLRRVVGGRIIGHHFETGNVVLKHIRDVLESPEIEKRPSFELQSHFEARRQTQSRVQEIESCCDLALFLSRNQASSVFHILVHDLNKCNIGTEPIYSSTKHTETESKL